MKSQHFDPVEPNGPRGRVALSTINEGRVQRREVPEGREMAWSSRQPSSLVRLENRVNQIQFPPFPKAQI